MRWVLTQVTIFMLLVAGVFVVPGFYVRWRATIIAQEYEPIVQAVADFHAETGIYPQDANDLAERDGITIPENVIISSYGLISIYGEAVHVSYWFSETSDGWSCSFGRLSYPPVKPSRKVVTGEARLLAALAEYDRRIEFYKDDKQHRSAKMSLLRSAGRDAEVYEECQRAKEMYPDWCLAHLGAALYATEEQRPGAEEDLKQWCDEHPAFIHYWYLAWYYRESDQIPNALDALAKTKGCPLEHIDNDETWVPSAFAFDAATFACSQSQPELLLSLCETWSNPQGTYSHASSDIPVFRTAALIQLGQFEEAKAEYRTAFEERGKRSGWAKNMDALGQAISKQDRTFIYDPGLPYEGFGEFSPFPRPEFDASDLRK
ncbi:MAG: hypothetical protein H6824_16305 [Planctomycetaceae bacterium]|nr:hypothetical protein [Planctomycetaceae bacterium]